MNYQWALLIAAVLIGWIVAARGSGKRAELARRLTVTERKLAQVIKKLELTGIDGIAGIDGVDGTGAAQRQPLASNPARQARFGPMADPATASAELGIGLDEVVAHLHQGRKIQAIKVYRELTGVGLKEAKDAVERMAGQR
ncbi:MAG TPA: ribosomal protein L7/L12 [Pseudonocardiaceae bacterium]|jgi:ribosomal protein L7/L12|nr:ribosomal protein L7/L12 [Pseudonocardiaceae bacterium]